MTSAVTSASPLESWTWIACRCFPSCSFIEGTSTDYSNNSFLVNKADSKLSPIKAISVFVSRRHRLTGTAEIIPR